VRWKREGKGKKKIIKLTVEKEKEQKSETKKLIFCARFFSFDC